MLDQTLCKTRIGSIFKACDRGSIIPDRDERDVNQTHVESVRRDVAAAAAAAARLLLLLLHQLEALGRSIATLVVHLERAEILIWFRGVEISPSR